MWLSPISPIMNGLSVSWLSDAMYPVPRDMHALTGDSMVKRMATPTVPWCFQATSCRIDEEEGDQTMVPVMPPSPPTMSTSSSKDVDPVSTSHEGEGNMSKLEPAHHLQQTRTRPHVARPGCSAGPFSW